MDNRHRKGDRKQQKRLSKALKRAQKRAEVEDTYDSWLPVEALQGRLSRLQEEPGHQDEWDDHEDDSDVRDRDRNRKAARHQKVTSILS